jgi:hypothetical protein
MTLSNELISFEARIDNVLKRSYEAGLDQEMRSSLARYACVLTSGYLEESVRMVIGAWCRDKSHPNIHTYVGRQLDWFLNPKCGKILDLLSHFSIQWRDDFLAALSDEEKAAIDSVVSNRNQIAHGRNVGISPEPMTRYFKCCRNAVRKLDSIVSGSADFVSSLPVANVASASSEAAFIPHSGL